MAEFLKSVLFIGQGMLVTFPLLLGSLFIGMLLSIPISVLRYKRILLSVINRIISILRGTPLILQLAFVYFSTPGIFGVKLTILTAGIITFGLNSFAYVSEILRSGIDNLPQGQFEAAKTLQIPTFHLWKSIILPQVMRNILPAMTSEVVALLKETALISTIGGMDIMRSAQTLAAQQFTYFLPLCIAGVYYYLLVLLIEYAGKQLERSLQYA